MKQSSNHYKQTSKLTQYSSGEDDSGTEDIFSQKDFIFSGYLHRPIDLKQKKTLSSSSNLRQNRLRRTGMIDTPVLSVTPARIETNIIRKTSTRLVSSTLQPNPAILKHSPSKNASVRHRSPVVRARLWTERNSESDFYDECGSPTNSEISQGVRVLCESNEQVPSGSGNTIDNISTFSQHGSSKKENSRKVLSDITKETVTDFRFQFPSYFSRDVLPLDAESNSKPTDSLTVRDVKNENSFIKKEAGNYDEPSTNGISSRSSTLSNSVDMSKEFKTTEEKGWFSLHYQKVSMILVIIVLLFFFGVGIMYLNVRFKDAQRKLSYEQESSYPTCDSIDDHQISCIKEDQLSTVISLLKSITPRLMAVARDSLCNTSQNAQPSMSDSEVLDYIVQNMNSVNDEDAKSLLRNVKLLVLLNPHWDVAVVNDYSVEELQNEINRDAVTNNDLLQYGKLIFRNPIVPFSCQLKLWLKTLLIWVSSSTAVCFVVTGMIVGLWDYKRRCELHRQEVYTLVNKIINAVRNHRRMQSSGFDGTSCVPVEVCKNEIFNNQLSKYPTSAWEEAVKFIEVHESRILTELHNVHGKPTKVWQWLCATSQSSEISAKPSNTNVCTTREEPENSPSISSIISSSHSGSSWSTKCRRNKVWQGQAFETIAGSPNSLPCSPTPCLKIRHMFDPDLEHGDDWPILIQDSILEKCEDVCILHLFVDCSSQEGCVFMKCSSSEEAGKAYRALHGWWFDTKLVTVKYLRTERYHERFPEAVSASSPLRPSNNQRLSLQELWRFPLEST